MREHEEVFESVLKRREEYAEKARKRRNVLLRTVPAAACACAAVLVIMLTPAGAGLISGFRGVMEYMIGGTPGTDGTALGKLEISPGERLSEDEFLREWNALVETGKFEDFYGSTVEIGSYSGFLESGDKNTVETPYFETPKELAEYAGTDAILTGKVVGTDFVMLDTENGERTDPSAPDSKKALHIVFIIEPETFYKGSETEKVYLAIRLGFSFNNEKQTELREHGGILVRNLIPRMNSADGSLVKGAEYLFFLSRLGSEFFGAVNPRQFAMAKDCGFALRAMEELGHNDKLK